MADDPAAAKDFSWTDDDEQAAYRAMALADLRNLLRNKTSALR